MLVLLVAVAEALGYLSAVPLCGVFFFSTRDGLRFGVGLGAFEARHALRRARRDSLRPRRKTKKRDRASAARALRLLWRLRGAGFSLRGSLGLGDAAATALACGALRGLAASLCAGSGHVEIDVAPLFDAAKPRAELQGMIRARSGQIITAIVRTNMDRLNRRIAKWTDIPSRAS